MNKLKLDIEYDYDFELIGISSHEKDYRICWALNKALNIELQQQEDLQIKIKSVSNYSWYLFENEEHYQEYCLVANRGNQAVLIPEQKQVDYFLMIRGVIREKEKEVILQNIKQIGMVLTAFMIDPNSLKSKQNLIF